MKLVSQFVLIVVVKCNCHIESLLEIYMLLAFDVNNGFSWVLMGSDGLGCTTYI